MLPVDSFVVGFGCLLIWVIPLVSSLEVDVSDHSGDLPQWTRTRRRSGVERDGVRSQLLYIQREDYFKRPQCQILVQTHDFDSKNNFDPDMPKEESKKDLTQTGDIELNRH